MADEVKLIEAKPEEKKPGCPQCHADKRHLIKQGPAYRKKTKESPRVKVQVYQCTECGYKGRGNSFNMPEDMNRVEEVKKGDDTEEEL